MRALIPEARAWLTFQKRRRGELHLNLHTMDIPVILFTQGTEKQLTSRVKRAGDEAA